MIIVKTVSIACPVLPQASHLYIAIKTVQNEHYSHVLKTSHITLQWDLQNDSVMLCKDEYLGKIVVELWEYDSCKMIAVHTVEGLEMTGQTKKRSYFGQISKSQRKQMEIKIDYERVICGLNDLDEVKQRIFHAGKGRQTKRTNYTNRESKASIKNSMKAQPITKISSLVNSISQRSIRYVAKSPDIQLKSPSKLFGGHIRKKHGQIA